MKHNILDRIDQAFKNPQGITMQQMESFVHEMLGFFESLRTTLVQGTEEEKKEARIAAKEIQQKLQMLAQNALEKTAMSETDVQRFLSSGNFPKNDLKMLHNAQQEIADFKETLK